MSLSLSCQIGQAPSFVELHTKVRREVDVACHDLVRSFQVCIGWFTSCMVIVFYILAYKPWKCWNRRGRFCMSTLFGGNVVQKRSNVTCIPKGNQCRNCRSKNLSIQAIFELGERCNTGKIGPNAAWLFRINREFRFGVFGLNGPTCSQGSQIRLELPRPDQRTDRTTRDVWSSVLEGKIILNPMLPSTVKTTIWGYFSMRHLYFLLQNLNW